ncbi:hypothetical protein EDC04DRAFT_2600155 [Pisolithus marmoratus]|nr:hypothetical protein EDC04DRAFT_2600155 [Pisolithus marmoratus]
MSSRVLSTLNGAATSDKKKRAALEVEMWFRGYVGGRYNAWLEEMSRWAGLRGRAEVAVNPTLGYVTADVPVSTPSLLPFLTYYSSPDYTGSATPNVTDDTLIDFVFIDFTASDVIEYSPECQELY